MKIRMIHVGKEERGLCLTTYRNKRLATEITPWQAS